MRIAVGLFGTGFEGLLAVVGKLDGAAGLEPAVELAVGDALDAGLDADASWRSTAWLSRKKSPFHVEKWCWMWMGARLPALLASS